MSTMTSSPPEKGARYQGCPRCNRRRKMKVLRPVDETGLEWFNCLSCNALICFEWDEDENAFVSPQLIGDFGAPAPECFRTYVPEQTYEIGEFIYHQTWRDVGKVIGEKELPGGRCSIDVAFLNYGPKMLIVRAEPLPD